MNFIENNIEYKNKIKEECSICFESLEKNDIVILNCNHIFHYKCIGNWMKSIHNNNIKTDDKFCPICWNGDEIKNVICREKYVPPVNKIENKIENNINRMKKISKDKCIIC